MFIDILTSISKVAIIAFIITFAAILFELYILSKREKKVTDKKNVDIPDFAGGKFQPIKVAEMKVAAPKKAAVEEHGLSGRYILTLVGMCLLILAIVAGAIMWKGKPVEEEAQIILPTRTVERPTVMPSPDTLVPTAEELEEVGTLDFVEEEEAASGGAQILAQAPSPTPTSFLLSPTPVQVSPTASTSTPTPTLAILSPTAIASSSATPSPTKKTTVTLPVTGGLLNTNLLFVVTAFALIMFAFMF